MLTLYVKRHCPFCDTVVQAAQELGVELEFKDIRDPVIVSELVMRGGKRQVPYLVDADRGVEMYESADIVRYLRETCGDKSGLQ